MSYDKQRVIDVALSQLGYHEKASNAQLDSPSANPGSANWTKYARDLDKLGDFYNGPKNGFAWCDIFVDWCFVTAYGRAAAQFLLCQPNDSAGAGCIYSAQYFQSKGQFFKTGPQTGDQIFFGSAGDVYHTGLVVEVGGGYVTTIEGNSADRVQKCRYAVGDSRIWGYGRPAWDGDGPAPTTDASAPTTAPATGEPIEVPDAPVTSTFFIELPYLMIGDKDNGEWGPVHALQALLIAQNYECGNKPLLGHEKPDGDFGTVTEKNLGFYQSKHHLEVDGIAGPETWKCLLTN